MGLVISHSAFYGSYTSFNEWRLEIATRVGIPLKLMEGYYIKQFDTDDGIPKEYKLNRVLPIGWDTLKPNPLHELLYHSDCEGYLNYSSLKKMLPKLEELIVNEPKDTWFYQRTHRFIEGAMAAIEFKHKLTFN